MESEGKEGLYQIIQEWIDNRMTGSIKINFFKGGIANLNLTESIKIDDKTPKGGSYETSYRKSKECSTD